MQYFVVVSVDVIKTSYKLSLNHINNTCILKWSCFFKAKSNIMLIVLYKPPPPWDFKTNKVLHKKVLYNYK